MISPFPIVSLSLNPAIDLTYQVPSLQHEQKSRSTVTRYDPGGTGINVGRALKQLNANTHTCYISAGKMGEFLDGMLSQSLDNLYCLHVEGETRINTTILQQTPCQQYEVNATGPNINHQQLDIIIQQLLTRCQQGIAVLTGSLPPNTPINTYQVINTALKAQGARAIIDAPIPVLTQAIKSQPFLIKPNLHELQILCKKELNSIEKIAQEARQLIQQGVGYVCVSLAEQGALLATPKNSYHGNSPLIKTNSTVGAGDSMVAALAYGFNQGISIPQVLTLAIACGAGTAKKSGTQLFNPAELAQLSAQINITTLDI